MFTDIFGFIAYLQIVWVNETRIGNKVHNNIFRIERMRDQWLELHSWSHKHFYNGTKIAFFCRLNNLQRANNKHKYFPRVKAEVKKTHRICGSWTHQSHRPRIWNFVDYPRHGNEAICVRRVVFLMEAFDKDVEGSKRVCFSFFLSTPEDKFSVTHALSKARQLGFSCFKNAWL